MVVPTAIPHATMPRGIRRGELAQATQPATLPSSQTSTMLTAIDLMTSQAADNPANTRPTNPLSYRTYHDMVSELPTPKRRRPDFNVVPDVYPGWNTPLPYQHNASNQPSPASTTHPESLGTAANAASEARQYYPQHRPEHLRPVQQIPPPVHSSYNHLYGYGTAHGMTVVRPGDSSHTMNTPQQHYGYPLGSNSAPSYAGTSEPEETFAMRSHIGGYSSHNIPAAPHMSAHSQLQTPLHTYTSPGLYGLGSNGPTSRIHRHGHLSRAMLPEGEDFGEVGGMGTDFDATATENVDVDMFECDYYVP
ncbi:hypothetical protein C8Q73DRAFT_694692 [Cubamyces lactineus]|nr:hypothetical protein C8Q73DRAFT_694625 [Cubamyces lactineus]KAH9894145.1 hypothetical protein C8Q73DRAFT_694692 [Cubamyces lactineus]